MALRAALALLRGHFDRPSSWPAGIALRPTSPAASAARDLGPSPHELFPAALAACTVWALVSYVAAACPLRRSIENGFTFDERIELAARAA